jgi:hypothetical protein
MTPWYWICGVVSLASALISFGFSIVASRVPEAADHANALYALSRSVALVVLCVVPLVHQSAAWLTAAAMGMIVVQAGDALVGRVQRDIVKTFGPASLAVVTLLVLIQFRQRA